MARHDTAQLHAGYERHAARSRFSVQRRIVQAAVANGQQVPFRAFGTRLRLRRNQTVFSEGDGARYIYEVVAGAVRTCKHLADGRRQIVDFALNGDFIGLEPCKEFTFTAEAVSDAAVVAYARRRLEHCSDGSPSLRRWLITMLERELSRAQNHLVILGRQSAMERVATFLLMLAERSHAEEGEPIDVPMSRLDIADYLGLTIETVCRLLGEMRRRQVIQAPDLNEVLVKDMELLRRFAAGEDAAFAIMNRRG